ncbi:MAG: WD40 repeat domain-containing protein [Caldilineaceae bacterium]|nr:WD40 repeat domain-containing protein [Caldilineaceae bacterium]
MKSVWTRLTMVAVVALAILTAGRFFTAMQTQAATGQAPAAIAQQQALPPANVIVQVGELAPAAEAAAPTGWDTEWSQLLKIRLMAQLDSSGEDAWSPADHPLVYVTSQGPGYGSAAVGGAFLSEVQKAPGLAIIDADTYESVATAQYETGLETYSENHGLGVSPDGQWIYTQGNHPDSTLRGNAVLNIINARTLKLDKIIETRVHHARVIHNAYTGKDLVLIDGWGTFFALDPEDDNRVVGAVDPADLQGSGYLAFGDPTGKWLLISVRTGFLESDGGIAVVSLEDWKVKARINTHDGSPIWVAFSGDGKIAYVSDGHDSKVAKIDMSAENPAMWRVTGMANAGAIGPYGLTLSWDDTMLFTIGKGEASHNQGKTVGYIDTRMFAEPDQYRGWGTVLGQLVTDCLRQDHAIIHPDAEKNEMWISCNSSFENVIVDMKSIEVKNRVPQPNGGSSHNGAFVAYGPDWSGELLSDTNGFHGRAVITKLQQLQPKTEGPPPTPTPEGPGAGK